MAIPEVKLCKNCKYFSYLSCVPDVPRCVRNRSEQKVLDLVLGNLHYVWNGPELYCSDERNPRVLCGKDICGPEGKYYAESKTL